MPLTKQSKNIKLLFYFKKDFFDKRNKSDYIIFNHHIAVYVNRTINHHCNFLFKK